MGGGRAAGRDVWVRVEDGRGGDGKLVLLARPGLSNAVGGRGNVGIAPARQGQSAIHPAAVKYAIDVICCIKVHRWHRRSQSLVKIISSKYIQTEIGSVSQNSQHSRLADAP
jgi:hypothetical protein